MRRADRKAEAEARQSGKGANDDDTGTKLEDAQTSSILSLDKLKAMRVHVPDTEVEEHSGSG